MKREIVIIIILFLVHGLIKVIYYNDLSIEISLLITFTYMRFSFILVCMGETRKEKERGVKLWMN
ncbi:hypothetical protein LCGC14_0596950 [marine sediment metagenome]|uniref:Uncharacterized protein n=1 Tax=marine sediment metagenome TaxID=412755 RepID=A0A0F9RVE2_9ZZZZ